jgi:uncharacterized protein
MPHGINAVTSGDALARKTKRAEIYAVLLTAAGKFIFMDALNWRLPFVLVVMTGWIGYVVLRLSQDSNVVRSWGFRFDNFAEGVRLLLPFATVGVLSFFVVGYYQDTINLSWHILPVLVLYPFWGMIQQYLVIAVVGGNLHDLRTGLPKFVTILFTAVLFGALHYPYYWLMGGTFVLALLYGYIYLSVRNIFALGLFHGWLGALFFYTVIDRDPFVEMFGCWLQ